LTVTADPAIDAESAPSIIDGGRKSSAQCGVETAKALGLDVPLSLTIRA
jgi:hypothetical protein